MRESRRIEILRRPRYRLVAQDDVIPSFPYPKAFSLLSIYRIYRYKVAISCIKFICYEFNTYLVIYSETLMNEAPRKT